MDSLEIEGKEYISAKRAAREHSYTMDYVGQLIRGGKLVGKKVGRAWYVEQESLQSYIASLLKPEHMSEPLSHKDTPEVEAETPASPETPEEVREEIVAPADKIENFSEEAVVPVSVHVATPVRAQMAQEQATPHAYHYPMLNYVQEQEEIESMPNLRGSDSNQIRITRTSAPQVEERYEEQYENRYEDLRAPRGRQQEGRALGRRVSYLPTLFQGSGKIAVAAVAIVFAVSIITASVFFTKTMSYESSTASVVSGVEYSSVFTGSR